MNQIIDNLLIKIGVAAQQLENSPHRSWTYMAFLAETSVAMTFIYLAISVWT